MRLLVLAGFLGSGKTTLLLNVAQALVASGRKLAIIENEVGTIGIDDRVLSAAGLQVRELYSGCVCCTLRLDLVTTLLALEREVSPDIVILEPSGVAGAAAVRQAFLGYGGDLEGMAVVVLVDAPRLDRLAGQMAYFLEASLAAADLAVITKIDAVPPAQAERAVEQVRRLQPGLPVIPISAQTHANEAALLQHLTDRLFAAAPPEPRPAVTVPVPAASRPAAAAAASRSDWEFAAPVATSALADAVAALTTAVAAAVQAHGTQVFGHIKASLEVPDHGLVVFSLTGAEAQPQRRGALTAGLTQRAAVRVNAILCGIDKPTLQSIVNTALAAARPEF
jgi:G3E family GTPase